MILDNANLSRAPLRIGVDVGGTFTDLALSDKTGTLNTSKLLTTPRDPSEAILEGIEGLLRRVGADWRNVEAVIHGTTLVANTLIERTGATTGLITTHGFRDVLEIGTEMRYDMFDLRIERAPVLVPRHLRLTVAERVASDGRVLVDLDVSQVRQCGEFLAASGVTSVAVALFNAYSNPVHERRIAEILEQLHPAVDVSLSTEVAPEIREYERVSTTVASAYVRPMIRSYLTDLEDKFGSRGFRGAVYLVASNGGLIDLATAVRVPIRLVESGPSAGIVGATVHGRAAGLHDLIAFDMGGTTAKIALTTDEGPRRAYRFEAARARRFAKGSGLLLNIPVIDMLEIGAGGGSIAERDALGLLRVGPRSAGADPGPACYGRGGTRATVTDADVVLGYLGTDQALGGGLELRPEEAHRAIAQLGELLGMTPLAAAAGVHAVVNNSMATATRVQLAESGVDPRAYTMMAFGGAGPVHAFGVARLLGLGRVVCPPAAGVASALGMLLAPPMAEASRSYLAPLTDVDWRHVELFLAEMRDELINVLHRSGADPTSIRWSGNVEMRYVGQAHEVPVSFDPQDVVRRSSDDLAEAFGSAYRRAFGFDLAGFEAETITWRVRAEVGAELTHVALADSSNGGVVTTLPTGRSRLAYDPTSDAMRPHGVVSRAALEPGISVGGPILIEDFDTTLVVGVGATAHLDTARNVVVDVSPATAAPIATHGGHGA